MYFYFVADPEVLDLPLLKKPLHFYKDRSEAPQVLHDVDKLIKECDGFVIVSAEYNQSLPPALTNTIDHFPPASYRHRPAGVVLYSAGRFAGVRAGVIIRAFLSEIGTLHIPATFTIGQVQNAFSEDGVPADDRTKESATRMLNELDWYAHAISEYKEKHGLPEAPKQ